MGDDAGPGTPAPAGPDALRASDAERDRAAAALGDAVATGRLTPEEHDRRLDRLYAARTRGDLAALLADLPVGDGTALAPHHLFRKTSATLAKVERAGQWTVPPASEATARFGVVILDLRHAAFPDDQVTIQANCLFGKVEILVPDNARVFDTGTVLLGRRTLPDSPPAGAEGPVVHVQGRSRLGVLKVSRGKARWPWARG